MKKSYWWRYCILVFALVLLGISYLFNNKIQFGICERPYQTDAYVGCLDRDILFIGYPLYLFGCSLILTSFFLFFVSDRVFKTWLRFALIWFIISFVWIASVPAYDSGMFSMMNFTKGIVARIMSVLFVPVSLGVLFFAARKERKSVD